MQLGIPQRSLHIIMFVLRHLNCRPVVIVCCYLNLNQNKTDCLISACILQHVLSQNHLLLTKNQISNNITTLISLSIWKKNLPFACSQQSWLTSIIGLEKSIKRIKWWIAHGLSLGSLQPWDLRLCRTDSNWRVVWDYMAIHRHFGGRHETTAGR